VASMEAEIRGEASIAELVKHAIDESRVLVHAEVQLAKQDLRSELKSALGAAGMLAAGLFAGLFALGALLSALLIALGLTVGWALFIVGGTLLVIALTGILVGIGIVPKRPMGPTRDRLREDAEHLKAAGGVS